MLEPKRERERIHTYPKFGREGGKEIFIDEQKIMERKTEIERT